MAERVRIVPVTAPHLPGLADMLGRAFLEDALIRWPMVEVPDMQPRVSRHFAAVLDAVIGYDTLWESDDGAGCANWVPPGSAGEALETTDDLKETLEALTDDAGARYDILWDWIEARVPANVWYLDMIGVDPARQGEGIGSALMRFGLERAAADGADAFLETSVPGNVAYYERFGFRVVEEGEPVEGAPHIWFMRTGTQR